MPGIDLLAAGAGSLTNLPHVFVILFGVGSKDTEGIYSLRAFNDDGLPQETIIVFEAEEDAVRYSGLLEATMTHEPSVCSIPPTELLDFCRDSGYQCRMEPAGSLLIPPDFNVGVTDWERSQRLREGRWAVLKEEPPVGGQQIFHTPVPHPTFNWSEFKPVHAPGAPGSTWEPSSSETHKASDVGIPSASALSEHELSVIRARLEMLLPASEQEDDEQA